MKLERYKIAKKQYKNKGIPENEQQKIRFLQFDHRLLSS